MKPLEKIASYYENEKKAIQWLKQICSENEWVTIESQDNAVSDIDVVHFQIELKGESQRTYRIEGVIARGEDSLVSLQPEHISGIDEKADERDGKVAWCSLCLNPSETDIQLPLGDRLCSLLLALQNDVELAKSIALVNLFLAHDYSEHKWIIGYHSDGMYLPCEETELYDLIPEDIRQLNYHFSCIEDELQYACMSENEKQMIIDEEVHRASEKIREKKQSGE